MSSAVSPPRPTPAPASPAPTTHGAAPHAAVPVTVARGDGIGPEIMDATLAALDAAGARLAVEEIQIGQPVYLRGVTAGIEPQAWESLRRTRVFLKAPITTPQGGGFKSLNVTTRKTLGLYANVRPCRSYHPFVATRQPEMDVVIVRENEEDLYAGIEHRQTDEVVQCLKLITRPGTEKIVRYAFDYARRNGRKKVTCFTKDNIMKLTDGLFHQVFDDVARDYPEIANEHWIVDIGAAKLADAPGQFDVVVMPNLYGDILSDVAAEVAGSVGLAGSANIGEHAAMFEAIHGSAPRRAGQDLANPSGLMLAGVMMLVHIGQTDAATRLHNAWLRTIEDGVHTYDVYTPGLSVKKVGTRDFTRALTERMGLAPQKLKAVHYTPAPRQAPPKGAPVRPAKKDLLGVDVFLHWNDANRSPAELGRRLEALPRHGLRLKMITNRGVKVYPDGFPETFCTDHWRCRFLSESEGGIVTHAQVIALLDSVSRAGFDFIKTENLCAFNGLRAYSLGQGE